MSPTFGGRRRGKQCTGRWIRGISCRCHHSLPSARRTGSTKILSVFSRERILEFATYLDFARAAVVTCDGGARPMSPTPGRRTFVFPMHINSPANAPGYLRR